MDRLVSASGRRSNVFGTSSTERLVMEREVREKKISMIESCAEQAAGDIWPYIIENVCYGKSGYYLEQKGEMACCRAVFYRRRVKFFIALHQAKEEAEYGAEIIWDVCDSGPIE